MLWNVVRARSLTGTSTGVRRLRLSRTHVPLHPTYTSSGAVRESGRPRTNTSLEVDALNSILGSGSVRKESRNITTMGDHGPPNPSSGGNITGLPHHPPCNQKN